jgi:hypothetical protein
MKLLLFISNAFINVFGITQPTERNATRAAWFIALMLTSVLVAVGVVAAFAIHFATRH